MKHQMTAEDVAILHKHFRLSDLIAALDYTKKGSARSLIWNEILNLKAELNVA